MPIYEYICKSCGDNFEVLLKNTDETVLCKNCGSDSCVKQLSAPAVSSAKKLPDHGNMGCRTCPSSMSCPSAKGF